MLGFDRSAARATFTAVLILLILYITYLLRKVLFVFTLALLLAYLLSPLVNLLDRLLPTSRTRTPALALAYVLFVGGLIFTGIEVGSTVVDQANSLAKRFPELIRKWETPSPSAPAPVNTLKEQAIAKVRESVTQHSSDVFSSLAKAGLTALTVAGDLVYVVVIPILAFFFLKDGRQIRAHFIEMIEDGPYRELIEEVLADAHLLLAHYMRALVILSAATMVSFNIAFAIMGVPYSVLLGVLAGLLEFIPMLGPLVAAVTIIVVAGVSGMNVLPILIFVGVYRLFQDYVLSPHVMGSGVEMHPLLVLLGIFGGAEIAGIAGTFLSVPVIALLRIVYRRIRRVRRDRRESRLAPEVSTL